MTTVDLDACEMMTAIFPTRTEAALSRATTWAYDRDRIRLGDTTDLAHYKLQGRRARRAHRRGRVPDARRGR
jgi:hypothetical protein